MTIKFDKIVFFVLIIISNISCFFPTKLLSLSRFEYSLVNEDEILKLKDDFLKKFEIIKSQEEEQNLSAIVENAQNIYIFELLESKIGIFIDNFIFIFSSEGNFIKKIKISGKYIDKKYIVFPYYRQLKEKKEFTYIILYINNEYNLSLNFHLFNNSLDRDVLLSKDEILIFNDKEKPLISNEHSFTGQLINDKILFFFQEETKKEIIIKEISINPKTKKLQSLNSTKLESVNIKGKIINSFINKEKSKIMILYSLNNKFTNNISYVYSIYDIIKKKFEFQNHNNAPNNEFIFLNIDYDLNSNKYIIHELNRKIEVSGKGGDSNLGVESNKKFIYDKNKLKQKSFYFINYCLLKYNRNYQMMLFLKNNNPNNDNKNPDISFNLVDIKENNIKLRKLENGDRNDGDNPSDQKGEENNEKGDQGGGQSDNQGGDQGGGQGDNPGGDQGGGQGDNQGGDKRQGQTPGGYSFDFDNKNSTIPKDEIKENRDSIMSLVKPGETYELKGDDYSIKVAPMGQNQQEEGATSIDFRECEQKLREYYNLGNDTNLTVFQTETTSSNEKRLTNKVQYVVYDENNTLLNLSVCEDQQIRVNYAIKEDSDFNLTKYSYFEDQGIDILNSSEPFFNDICYPYSDGTSDMILSDRINEIYQNYSLCDSGCEYEGLNATTGVISCSCSVSTDDSDDDDDTDSNLKEIILSLFSDSTFGVIKCHNLVFSSSKASNIGFWLFLIIVVGHIPLYVWFFKKGVLQIKNYIEEEMIKYHYISKNEPKEKEDKNNNNIDNNMKIEEIEDNNEIKISNPPPKKSASRNIDGDLIQKSENIKIAKNTVESTESDELSKNEEKQNNKILIKESNKNILDDDKIKVVVDNNNTEEEGDQPSKRNENLIAVYKTEETLSESDRKISKKKSIESQKNLKTSYFLIQIDANNSSDRDRPKESNYILNNYQYETAIKYETRTFWRVLYIVMISKNNILNTFILKSPLESKPLQICLLLFSYISDLALNTLFYFSDNISDKYHYTGNNLFWYTLFNNILISVISTVLSLIIGGILKLMENSKDNMEEQFKKEEKKLRENPEYKVSNERKNEIKKIIEKELKKLKIKMVVFVTLDFILLLLFFYFVTAFCEVYKNTQTSWISDAIVSIIISFPIELAISLAITILYFLAIKYKWKYVYKLAMFLA